MERYKFSDIFSESPDGNLTPKRKISIYGDVFGLNHLFKKGVNIYGIDFYNQKYSDIAGEEEDGTIIIKGFYIHGRQ